MTDVKRLLVPVDFSESSKKAVAYGVALAEKTGAKLYLAHVLADVPAFGYLFPDGSLDTDARCLAGVRDALFDLLPANRDELHYELIAKIGAVEDELPGIVHDENIDLVIMGSHGRTRLRRWFLGSVTEHLLRKLAVPVLTVSHITPEHEAAAGKIPAIQQILFATDLGAGAETGLSASVQLARYFNATLTVAHVEARPLFLDIAPPFPATPFFAEDAKAIATQMHELMRPHSRDVKIHPVILRGTPHEAILQFADKNEIDLIVLNLERKSALERVLLGTTAEEVVRLAHMPVLSVPVDVLVSAAGTSVA
jgi:nucleotide-binding universal stress UspA family protein